MGEQVDARSDIYSLGCMLYELLSGQRPFRANSNVEIMQMHVEQVPRMFRSICPDRQIPESLEAIVRTCLAKKVELRYQTMSELLADLKVIGSESLAETKLKAGLKEELKRELEAFKRSQLKRLQNWLYPLMGISLLACAGFVIYNQLVPESKIIKLKKELKTIKNDDENRFERELSLSLQIVELDRKSGNQQAALIMLKTLDKHIHEMPPSVQRSKYLARIARYYSLLGRPAESEALFEQVIAELTAHIEYCNKVGNLAAMEPASMLVVKLCKDVPDKLDLVIGQYNKLIPMYIFKGNYQKAEQLSNDALAIIHKSPRSYALRDIGILQLLGKAQLEQKHLADAESTLLRAWNLSVEKFSAENAVSRAIGTQLVNVYELEGKQSEAEEIKSAIK